MRRSLASDLVLGGVGVVDVVGWVEHSHVGELSVHQALDVRHHGGVAAEQAVIAEDPEIAGARGRNDRDLGKLSLLRLGCGSPSRPAR